MQKPKTQRVEGPYPGAALVVTLGDGTTREFVHGAISVDEQGSLLIMRVTPDDEFAMVMLYAPGVWNTVEQLPAPKGE